MEIAARSFNLAQLNIARLLAPVDSPELSDFVANLGRINAVADSAPGFIWRLQGDDGDATGVKYFGADFVVNMSVWQSLQSLRDYVYRSAHIEVMRRKREWFQKLAETHMVLWWVPAGHIPSLEEAELRLKRLRAHGPTPWAFTFKKAFSAPGSADPVDSLDISGTCPAT